jgi:hypothetical protein
MACMRQDFRTFGGVLGLVIIVWLLYLAIKVAQHVNAWPFG